MSKQMCPSCRSEHTVKNGQTRYGKPNRKCKDCGRQFVDHPQHKLIAQATKDLIDQLLFENIPLAGIARVCDVSESWLQTYVNQIYEALVPRQVQVTSKKGCVTIQCDEMWSFVGDKGIKQWIWLALDMSSREIVGVYVGGRLEEGARRLWDSLPRGYRQCALAYTDFWDAYGLVCPATRHQAMGKEPGKTSDIVRVSVA